MDFYGKYIVTENRVHLDFHHANLYILLLLDATGSKQQKQSLNYMVPGRLTSSMIEYYFFCSTHHCRGHPNSKNWMSDSASQCNQSFRFSLLFSLLLLYPFYGDFTTTEAIRF